MDGPDGLERPRTESDEGLRSDQSQNAVAQAVVSLVTILFAPLLAMVANTTIGMAGFILLVGGATAVALGVTAIASSKGGEMAMTMAIFGCIFGVIEIVVGLNHIASL